MTTRASYDRDYSAPTYTDEPTQQLLATNTSRKFHGLMDIADRNERPF